MVKNELLWAVIRVVKKGQFRVVILVVVAYEVPNCLW